MCTVSWDCNEERTRLWFNRDELNSRDPAEPPVLHDTGSSTAIYPRDPVGGGTWLGVNSNGLILGLLNFYEQGEPSPTFVPERRFSRGQVVVELLAARSPEQAWRRLQSLPLKAIAPFHLLVLQEARPYHWSWTGKPPLTAVPLTASGWFTTSSLLPDEGTYRGRRYAHLNETLNGDRLHEAFHSDCEEGKESWAVRMKRADRRTVSLSRIRIDAERAEFAYDDFHGLQTKITLPLENR